MGIEPFLVGSSIDCVLAQRLVRRLCGKCRQPYHPTAESLATAGIPSAPADPPPTLYRAVGCRVCSKTGYQGRLALHEVMQVTETIERMAVERASAEAIGRVAREQGMRTLRDDGMAKVLRGDTSMEEILRVVG